MPATASPVARRNGETTKSVPPAAAPPPIATAGEPEAGAGAEKPQSAAVGERAADTDFTLAAPGVSWGAAVPPRSPPPG
jgi:hypothetical protein